MQISSTVTTNPEYVVVQLQVNGVIVNEPICIRSSGSAGDVVPLRNSYTGRFSSGDVITYVSDTTGGTVEPQSFNNRSILNVTKIPKGVAATENPTVTPYGDYRVVANITYNQFDLMQISVENEEGGITNDGTAVIVPSDGLYSVSYFGLITSNSTTNPRLSNIQLRVNQGGVVSEYARSPNYRYSGNVGDDIPYSVNCAVRLSTGDSLWIRPGGGGTTTTKNESYSRFSGTGS